MKSLFLRLYAMLIAAFLCIGWSVDYLFTSAAKSADVVTDLELHKGSLFLLNRELTRLPTEMHASHIKAISQSFGYPVTLVEPRNLASMLAAHQLTLSEGQQSYLEAGSAVSVFDNASHQGWFMQNLSDNSQVIVMGPIRHARDAHNSQLYSLVLFAGLAVVVVIWMYPLSKGLLTLMRTAVQFGKGNFNARVPATIYRPLFELASRFNDMAQRIQRLIKVNKELSHAVSHELRTPIARIRFAAEMARTSPDFDKRERYFETIDNNIEELDCLIEELLMYARFDRDQYDLNIEYTDLVALCNDIAKTVDFTEPDIDVSLQNTSQTVIHCHVDLAAMKRVLDNLLRNACRHAKSRVEIRVKAMPDVTQIEVTDDGPGVPVDDRDRLFEPFFRLDESRDKKSGGLGLGLAIVRGLVTVHHGEVSIDTSELGGACFRISLPNKR